jgi:hypothetical protein
MTTLSTNRHSSTKQSPKDILRHHIEQLSLDQQWEFIVCALQLIAARPVLREAEVVIDNRRPIMPVRR